ncbi:WD40-repeat-containing domain protein [Absidia repens]|uniref:WD40-repeat-containing domain protein n=1 Tax=Absidia repens TaxID=90262 RepID=A0A1X2I7W9_9FUNG|nr:WD40-repeat-containing domain protein [Absidia repens]
MLGESNPVDYSLPGVLHYLQAEWRRFERERNEWTIERAELKARIALLEGERRGVENLKSDLVKRVKMLEYALRQERKRYIGSDNQQPPKNVLDDKVEVNVTDIPNFHPQTQPSTTVSRSPNTPTVEAIADTKLRERSRQALKTCLQEINYLTSMPSKLPLTHTFANSIRNTAKQVDRPSSSQQHQTSYISSSSVISSSTTPKPSTKQTSSKSPATPKSNNRSKPPSQNDNGTNDNDSYQPRSPDTKIGTTRSMDEDATSTTITEDEGDDIQAARKQQPLVPITSVTPAVDNVDEVAILNNAAQQSSSDISSSDTPLDPITRDNIMLMEDDNEGLSKKMQEKYKISDEKVQKMLRNANKGMKKNVPRSSSPEPQEMDLTYSDINATTKDRENDTHTSKLWKTKMTFKGHLDSVRAVAFHPNDMLVATGSDDGTVKIINLQRTIGREGGNTTRKAHEDLDATATFRGHSNIVTSVAISGEQNRVYSASLDSTIRVWRLPSEQHGTFSPVDPSLYITTFIGHTDAIWDFKLSSNSSILASASADGKVKVWDTQGNGELLKQSWDYADSEKDRYNDALHVAPTCVDFCSADTNKLVVSYTNAKIKLFDIETGQAILTFTGSDDDYDSTCKTQINKVVSHPTMSLIVSGHEDRQVQFFDINSGKSTYKMSAHLDAVTSLDMDPSGMTFVSGGHDSSIRLWDMNMTKTCIQEFSAHRKKGDEGVLDIQYHRSFPWMVSGGADGIVKMYHHGH